MSIYMNETHTGTTKASTEIFIEILRNKGYDVVYGDGPEPFKAFNGSHWNAALRQFEKHPSVIIERLSMQRCLLNELSELIESLENRLPRELAVKLINLCTVQFLFCDERNVVRELAKQMLADGSYKTHKLYPFVKKLMQPVREEARNSNLLIRVSDTEKDEIKAMADAVGMTVSELIRSKLEI